MLGPEGLHTGWLGVVMGIRLIAAATAVRLGGFIGIRNNRTSIFVLFFSSCLSLLVFVYSLAFRLWLWYTFKIPSHIVSHKLGA